MSGIQLVLLLAFFGSGAAGIEDDLVHAQSSEQLFDFVADYDAQTLFHLKKNKYALEGVTSSVGGVTVKAPYPYFDFASNYVAYAAIYQRSGKEVEGFLPLDRFDDATIKAFDQATAHISPQSQLRQIREAFLEKESFGLAPKGETLTKLSDEKLGEVLLLLQVIRMQVHYELFSNSFVQLDEKTRRLILDHLRSTFKNQPNIFLLEPKINPEQRDEIIQGIKFLLDPEA
jgi:hypothetical protein